MRHDDTEQLLPASVKGDIQVAVTIGLPLESSYEFNVRRVAPASLDRSTIDAEIRHVERAMRAVVENASETPARDAAAYHLATGGGRTRARLAIASGVAWATPFRHRVAAAAACELLHNASLVHDDISDADTVRRGQPAVWHLYGRDIALCAGDLLLTSAFLVATAIDDAASSQALVRQLAQQSHRVIGGQSLEFAARGDQPSLSITEYVRATCAKTAPMFELPLRAGAMSTRLKAPTAETLRRFSEALGLAYQILDDLDDVAPERSKEGNRRQLHHLHAWCRHRSRARPSASSSQIRHRCLRHARAALGRALLLTHSLPAPLQPELSALVHQLMMKANRHAQADTYGSGDR